MVPAQNWQFLAVRTFSFKASQMQRIGGIILLGMCPEREEFALCLEGLGKANCYVINMHTAGGPGNIITELGDCPSNNKGIVIIIVIPAVHMERECDIVPRYFNEVK